jgi:hypothetical protein
MPQRFSCALALGYCAMICTYQAGCSSSSFRTPDAGPSETLAVAKAGEDGGLQGGPRNASDKTSAGRGGSGATAPPSSGDSGIADERGAGGGGRGATAPPSSGNSGKADVAGATDAGMAGAATDAVSCVTLKNTAPEIGEERTTETLPSAQGGTIIPGLYLETSQIVYGASSNGSTGKHARGTLLVEGNPLDGYSAQLVTQDLQTSGIMSTRNLELTISPMCSGSRKFTAEFSVIGTQELRLLHMDVSRVDSFVR